MEGQPRCQVIETGPVEHVCGSGKTFKSTATGMRAKKNNNIYLNCRAFPDTAGGKYVFCH